MSSTAPAPAPPGTISRTRHWLLFVAGILLILLGPPLYVIQFLAKHLAAPWYVPLRASAGVAFMFASVWRRRGVMRTLGLVFFTIVCGTEWFMLAIGTITPLYTGPAQPGRKVPEFIASLADGTPFTEKDLSQGSPTVLVFFRGRW